MLDLHREAQTQNTNGSLVLCFKSYRYFTNEIPYITAKQICEGWTHFYFNLFTLNCMMEKTVCYRFFGQIPRKYKK